MKTGDIIKTLRMEKGLTQEDLANRLGLKKSAIAKYENGRVENIKRSTIADMAKIFNVKPSYILGYEETPKYYVNKETAELAEKLKNNPQLSMIFDAAEDVSAEDLQLVYDMILRMKRP